MARKIVTVDELLRLPPEVEAALKGDLAAEFDTQVNQATAAASAATAAAASAALAQENIDSTIAEWNVDTNDMAVASLIEDPESMTRDAIEALFNSNVVIPVRHTGTSWPDRPANVPSGSIVLWLGNVGGSPPPTMAASDVWIQETTGVEGVWTPYSPTVSGWTLGNGSASGSYIKTGTTVHMRMNMVLGSTTSISGGLQMTPPVAPRVGSTIRQYGAGALLDDSASRRWECTVELRSDTGLITPLYHSTSNGMAGIANPTVPFDWAAGDRIYFNLTYESVA